jgi:hypothetical protein
VFVTASDNADERMLKGRIGLPQFLIKHQSIKVYRGVELKLLTYLILAVAVGCFFPAAVTPMDLNTPYSRSGHFGEEKSFLRLPEIKRLFV